MHVVILGGAGFIGSHLAQAYLERGDEVTVIDGLVPGTGGHRSHLGEPLPPRLSFLAERVEDVPVLQDVLATSDLVIDAIALTAHHRALDEPLLDLELNASSHLHVLQALAEIPGKRVLYLGSRGQYGSPKGRRIRENAPQEPTDVQGIHKVAAESYYRVYARMGRCTAASLRIPNCFGPHQPIHGDDIGLVGSLIRDLVAGNCVEVYGSGRSRPLLYVDDLTNAVLRLGDHDWPGSGDGGRDKDCGFDAYNVAGQQVAIEDLAQQIIAITGRGSYQVKEIPAKIRAMDTGAAQICQDKLIRTIGSLQQTNLANSLAQTVRYFEEHAHDVAL
ncbi:MAG: NAD(P)-dependent oxidoreductase [Planctomycetota bacterium]